MKNKILTNKFIFISNLCISKTQYHLYYLTAFILLNLCSTIIWGQNKDAITVKQDTTSFNNIHAFITYQQNYETYNNSFITGNSFATIRSQNNPKIFIDGMPINPLLINDLYYAEFLGSTHLLSFDLQNASVRALQANSQIVNSDGLPISEGIENYDNYNTYRFNTIHKQIGFNYQLKDNYVLGINYNKMSSLYFPYNNINIYQSNFQRATVSSNLGMSFKAKF